MLQQMLKNPQPSTIQWFSHDFDDEKPVLLLLLFCLRTHKSLLKSGISQWFKNLQKEYNKKYDFECGCMIAKIKNFEISLQGKHCGLPKLNFFPDSSSLCIFHSM